MNRSEKPPSVISTGTASLVLIFVMLCMLTFSVLSLVSAQADLRLSRKSAERTRAYYAAENAANDILIDILAARKRGLEADAVEGVYLTESGCAYEVPLGEDQVLSVELAFAPEGGYDILAWRTVSAYDWAPADTFDLPDMSTLPG